MCSYCPAYSCDLRSRTTERASYWQAVADKSRVWCSIRLYVLLEYGDQLAEL
jgi:hypothetical protein